jgi:hypothetical protein
MSTSISSGRAHLTFQYSPLVGWIARDARVAMAPSMQSNSLVASGSRITSIALSTVQALRAIVAAQSSATTETICLFVLPPHTHQRAGERNRPVFRTDVTSALIYFNYLRDWADQADQDNE